MPRLNPHAEAIYSVVPLGDGSFVVEVIVPETNPTRVTGFATEIAAGARIETHKRQVELNLPISAPQAEGRLNSWINSQHARPMTRSNAAAVCVQLVVWVLVGTAAS